VANIETVLVANHAEVVNGLLYISGAGWTDLWRGPVNDQAPPITHFGMAITVSLDSKDLGQALVIDLSLVHEGGKEVFRGGATVKVEPSPSVPEGVPQLALSAINIEIVFPLEGGYILSTALAGQQPKKVAFRVHDSASPNLSLPPVG
jgi:hypothetical protein